MPDREPGKIIGRLSLPQWGIDTDSYTVDRRFKAVTIGPDSDVYAAQFDTSSSPAGRFVVSVDRPWVGQVDGHATVRPLNPLRIGQQFDTLAQAGRGRLDLIFWDGLPPDWPGKRRPLLRSWASPGATTNLIAPVQGRRVVRWQIVAGVDDLEVAWYAVNPDTDSANSDGGVASPLINVLQLPPTGNVAANGSLCGQLNVTDFGIDGCDYLRITATPIAPGVAYPAAVRIEAFD